MKTIITVYSDGWETLSPEQKKAIPQYVRNHFEKGLKEKIEGRFAVKVNAIGVRVVNR